MKASERLRAELGQNSVGDWVLELNGRAVVGIVWDEGDIPLLVIWDGQGEADGRVFSLPELFPGMGAELEGS